MRNRHFLAVDVVGMAAIPFLALALRFEGFAWPESFYRTAVVFALLSFPVRLGVAFAFQLYQRLWRHASIIELERLLAAGAVMGAINFVIGTAGLEISGLVQSRMPYSALVIDALLMTGVLAATRLFVRFRQARQRPKGEGARTIVVGAGSAGELIAREARASLRANYQIVAFVDDDRRKLNSLLQDIRVEGRIDDLPRLIRELVATDVVIAMPSAGGVLVRRIVELAATAGARTRTVPSLADLVSGEVGVSALRPVELDDLLRRDPIVPEVEGLRSLVTGRVVLVTGAGGSIGSELCRQVVGLGPSLLVLLDHSENQMFEIERELRHRHPSQKLVPVIADVRDGSRVQLVFDRFKPFAVFHAAAHKHVPLMEENVVEAVTNNVLGTRNVIDAAVEHGTPHFVLISTDKAVRPTSIMGASKRVAEIIVRLAASKHQRHFVAVRFGNVLGSRGSVVPTFMQQIARGGPITVTHPEMRRYFMTIPEAVHLVLQAGALGTGGELFVLDMGAAVKIADLARDLIRLSGLKEGEDIEITYTGLRPGEKLYEEVLFGDEDVRQTAHPKVIRAISELPAEALGEAIDDLVRMATVGPHDDPRLRDALIKLVPDFIVPETTGAKTLPMPPRRSGEGRIIG